jgi:hypothetical protein
MLIYVLDLFDGVVGLKPPKIPPPSLLEPALLIKRFINLKVIFNKLNIS